MKFVILTLFPGMFEGPFSESILARAAAAGLIDIRIRNIRDCTHDKHHVTDDAPYGGGAGMVMKPDPIVEAVEAAQADLLVPSSEFRVPSSELRVPRSELQIPSSKPDVSDQALEAKSLDSDLGTRNSERGTRNSELGTRNSELAPARAPVIYLSPQGRVFNHDMAKRLAQEKALILICGRYEGVDQRVLDLVVDEEISIGDYVLTGGELPAMVLVDAIARQIPGVVGCNESVEADSFCQGLLDWPHYTRPEEYRGLRIPEVLLSGHHANIQKWRLERAVEKTRQVRPDLYQSWHKQSKADDSSPE
ncbi:MAG: tRNA (guanosine(37)-N1)-methyltransferase TrmD [Candidatus Sumerlaeota bacterium]|nr:tRNA (guanosine(37)-N1)-methyltransferase TrmD [Candidatus Sumerlaeota bacterium]